MRKVIAMVLLATAGLALLAGAGACTSSTGGAEVELAGRRFTIESSDQSPHSLHSIEEMERIAGFPFIFPSYLPEGIDDRMVLSVWAGGEETVAGVPFIGDPEESVLIYSKRPDAPGILITERRLLSPRGYPEPLYRQESHTIGGIDVLCAVENSIGLANNPFPELVFLCDWEIEDREFEALFSWTVGSPTPGDIAEGMRQEALKVIQSMIEAPIQADGPTTPTASGGELAHSPYHNVRPPEEYFRVLTPPLRTGLETSGIPRDSSGLPRENLVVTEQDYLAALSKAQSKGLEALSEDERLIILFVTAAALAAQEETIRYRVVAVDPVSGEEIGYLVTEERYRFDTYEDYTLPNLSQRRTVAEGMAWDFGASPHLEADAPTEVIESYEFINVGTDDEKVARIRCAKTGKLWERLQGDYTEQYGMSWFVPFFPRVDFLSLEAEPQDTEVIGGRLAYKLTEVEDFGPAKGTERRYWLDKETLWPLQWEFELDGETVRALGWDYEGGGYIIRGTVEEVDGEVNIRLLTAGGSCAE